MPYGHRPVRLRGGDYPLPDMPTGARVWHYAALPTSNLPSIGGLSCAM